MTILKRLHRDEEGQVMWFFSMTILALVVLAVAVANTGRQIARKIEMQNSADASAVSSAVWVARGMNVISMDNVGMTESLGLIANLRAMHVAWQVNEAVLVAEYYVASAMIDSIFLAPAGIVLMIGVGIGWIPTCGVEFADTFGACSPPSGIHTSGDDEGNLEALAHPTSGKLWDLMRTLEALSTAMKTVSPALAFAEAYNVGTENITHADPQEMRIALLMPSFGNGNLPGDPANPKAIQGGYGLPVEKGDFNELCQPTKEGTLRSAQATAVRKYGYSALRYSNMFGQVYDQEGEGPFEKYKYTFNKIWWPSVVTMMPEFIYKGLADLSFATLCGGEVPVLPEIEKRLPKLDEARNTPRAHKFRFLNTFVQTNYTRPSRDPWCDTKPTNTECFEPTNKQDVKDQMDELRRQMGDTSKSTSVDDVRGRQNGINVKPVFDPPIDNSSFRAWITEIDDKRWPDYRNCGPRGPVVSDTGEWCRLPNTDTFEKIHVQCKKNCPNNNPMPGQQPTTPPGPPEYLYFDERIVFQYAVVSESIEGKTKGLSSASGQKPQPMHITLGDGNLADHPDQLKTAVERMQFLAVAYRGTSAKPWWSDVKVTVDGRTNPVFQNPNSLGILTYAQSQVYNPTSWDLYTQNWHAKLVPADMLERNLGTFPSNAVERLLTMFQPVGSTLNAH
jgi:hypothetical protein